MVIYTMELYRKVSPACATGKNVRTAERLALRLSALVKARATVNNE